MVISDASTSWPQDREPLLELSHNRKKVWHNKTRTGCKTCKNRRIKCDETRPACQRCVNSNRTCDGYNPPKAWIFSLPSPESQAILIPSTSGLENKNPAEEHTPELVASTSDSGVDNPSRYLNGNLQKHHNNELIHTNLSRGSIGRPLPGPYRTPDDQYCLKYFLEVAAVFFARANMSAQFWLAHFPRLAYEFPSTQLALLTVSAAFKDLQSYINNGPDPKKTSFGLDTIERESQAMRMVARRNTSIEEVLADALAFWMTAMCTGDFGSALKHAFFARKILSGVRDPSKHDAFLLRYCASTSGILLRYFRATRGPCQVHLGDDFSNCEPSCIVPEDCTLEMRIADGLYHLRQALPKIEQCRYLLEKRTAWHSHYKALRTNLEIQETDFNTLIRRWTETDRLGLKAELLDQAAKVVPYTFSPFNPVIEEMIGLIQEDDQDLFGMLELELRMRVTLPTFIISVARGFGPIIVDTGLMTKSHHAIEKASNPYTTKTLHGGVFKKFRKSDT